MTPELWVEIIKAVAWPITVLALFLTFRKNILAAVAKVGRIRYGDFEAEFNQALNPVSPPELRVVEEIAKDTPGSQIAPDLRERLEELALNEADNEFGSIKRYISFFKRPDLFFYAASIGEDKLFIFDILVIGLAEELPQDHVDAVSARFEALRSEAEAHDIRGHLKLIFLIVTNRTGEDFLRLEKRLREKFARRRNQDIRLYHQDVLLAREERSEQEKVSVPATTGGQTEA